MITCMIYFFPSFHFKPAWIGYIHICRERIYIHAWHVIILLPVVLFVFFHCLTEGWLITAYIPIWLICGLFYGLKLQIRLWTINYLAAWVRCRLLPFLYTSLFSPCFNIYNCHNRHILEPPDNVLPQQSNMTQKTQEEKQCPASL